MGMYDTINGEQVKCFPWVSLYHGEINYHGGELAYFKKDSEVPFRKPHYNYGKNFLILDYNRYPDSKLSENYRFYVHIIEDGRVKRTVKDTLPKSLDWSKYPVVVGYFGELLNIHSNQEVSDFIDAQLDYFEKRDKIRAHHNELFKEWNSYAHGIALLAKESEERKFREQKIKKIHELMKEEDIRIESELKALNQSVSRWFTDTSSIDDLICLGDYISAASIKSDEKEDCLKKIDELLAADDTLYDRYVEWQGSDEYLKEVLEEKASLML